MANESSAQMSNESVFDWEMIAGIKGPNLRRGKVAGGWLVACDGGIAFVPDTKYDWKLGRRDVPVAPAGD